MKIASLNSLEKMPVDMEGACCVSKSVPVSKDDGSPLFAFRVFTIDPGGNTPYHTHPFEHINYVIEGSGVIVMETGEERPVKKGDFALVLPDEQHQYKNTSATDPMIMICAVPKEYE
jgi:quercetin dioxygenase-like cupin family protein